MTKRQDLGIMKLISMKRNSLKVIAMFVGRYRELSAIRSLLEKRSGSVLIYGKRKVGKTTLILQALKESAGKTVYYECLKASLQENIDGFVSALVSAHILPVKMGFASFQDVFQYLNSLDETLNIVIDEYPYLKLFTKGDTIDSIFQSIIDNRLGNIRLILSGSHIGMMRDLLEEKNALYGRFSVVIRLGELNYKEAAAFYPDKSAYDKVALYSVFGGSPFVNEQLDAKRSLKENILRTLLNPLSSIYSYAENMLVSDLAVGINAERIFAVIGNGKKKYSDIESKLGLSNNGLLSKQLKNLIAMDMIAKVYPINKEGDNKKVSYELTDNLMRFWFTYVYHNKGALRMLGAEAFYENYIAPTLTTYISRRFEEMARVYFSLQVKEGLRSGILHIGTYYYDDLVQKKNGEFDVALQRKRGYDFYEVKYLSSPLTEKAMRAEEAQIRELKGVQVLQIGFISVNGFEKQPSEFECIDGEALYS